MSPAALAALSAAAVLTGVLLGIRAVAGTARPAAPPTRAASRLRRLVGLDLSRQEARHRRGMIAAATAATAGVWLISGWPVVGLLAGLAVLGLPWLFTVGRDERRMIAQLEAVEAWTRRLKDVVRLGTGLNAAIIASARTAPAAIADEVATLAAALRAGADPQQALDDFADALADFAVDEVVAALKLHAGERGQRLSDVLASLADAAAAEVAMRRGVSAKRAEPRFVTRFMTTLIAVVLLVVFTNTAYARPYATTLGRLVLLACALVLVALLAWIRRLTLPARRNRLLARATSPVPALPAQAAPEVSAP